MTNINAPSMSDGAQKIREGAVELKSAVLQQGQASLSHACDATEAEIKANPYRSMLIAFGVGALLGVVLFRR